VYCDAAWAAHVADGESWPNAGVTMIVTSQNTESNFARITPPEPMEIIRATTHATNIAPLFAVEARGIDCVPTPLVSRNLWILADQTSPNLRTILVMAEDEYLREGDRRIGDRQLRQLFAGSGGAGG
jgi:hypothetical protein